MPLWQPQSAVARPAYYDREPAPVTCAYSATHIPHGGTVRATYSPPVGFAAFMETGTVLIRRAAVAAPAQAAAFEVDYLPSGGGSVIVAFLPFILNVVGDNAILPTGVFGYMAFGDTIQLLTFDFSVGGSLQFTGAIKGTEFLF